MTIKLYTMRESPPGRIVQMTLSCLNLKHELILLDLRKGEARTPEYLEVIYSLLFFKKKLMQIVLKNTTFL